MDPFTVILGVIFTLFLIGLCYAYRRIKKNNNG